MQEISEDNSTYQFTPPEISLSTLFTQDRKERRQNLSTLFSSSLFWAYKSIYSNGNLTLYSLMQEVSEKNSTYLFTPLEIPLPTLFT
jgi:hypothetical protein